MEYKSKIIKFSKTKYKKFDNNTLYYKNTYIYNDKT